MRSGGGRVQASQLRRASYIESTRTSGVFRDQGRRGEMVLLEDTQGVCWAVESFDGPRGDIGRIESLKVE